jgi:hypothetical protein
LRGKPWSIDEERLLRQLVEEGKGTEEICQAMGKTRVSVKAKLFNLGLFLKDATVTVQNRVASASAAATSPGPIDPAPTPNIDPDPLANPDLVEVVEADLKTKRPLPSVDEKMRELDDATKALHQKGLSPTEIKRLSKIIDAAKVYNQLFEKYAHYRELENELMELRRQLAEERSKK